MSLSSAEVSSVRRCCPLTESLAVPYLSISLTGASCGSVCSSLWAILVSMMRRRKAFASFLAVILLVLGLTGVWDEESINETEAAWSSSQETKTSTMRSAEHIAEVASQTNSSNQNYAVRSIIYPNFKESLRWWEWTNHPNTERASHFALRRHAQTNRSDTVVSVDSIEVVSNFRDSEKYADNFSWELYNLRGLTASWGMCNPNQIDNIRTHSANGGDNLMASGSTMNEITRTPRNHTNYLSHSYAPGGVESGREGNFCLIVTEEAGMNYRPSVLGECFFFEFKLNIVASIEGAGDNWRQPITVSTEMLNVGSPGVLDSERCV